MNSGRTAANRIVLADGTVRYRPNKSIAVVLAIYLVVVAGFRYQVGTDYGAYYKHFTGGWQAVWKNVLSFNEPGMTLLSTIGRIIYNDGIAAIFCASLFTIALYVSQIYKYSPMFTVSMLLYLFAGDWHGSFNGVRQYLAAAVLFAGHRYILERKFLKYCITVFLAALFHRSALIMIVPYFLLVRKPDWKQMLLLAAGAVAIRLSYSFVFDVIEVVKEGSYASDSYAHSSVNILRILAYSAPIVVYIFICRKGQVTKEEAFYLNAMLLNSFTWIAAGGSTYLCRVGIYTNAATLIGYPFLLRRISNGSTRKLITVLMLVLFFFFWRYELTISSALKYHWWFTARDSFY